MHHLTELMPAVSRLIKLSALGGISAVVAAAATLSLISGTTNPWSWLSTYERAQRCAVADGALITGCTAVVAAPAVNVQVSPEPSPPDAIPTPKPTDNAPPAAPVQPPPATEVDGPDGGDS